MFMLIRFYFGLCSFILGQPLPISNHAIANDASISEAISSATESASFTTSAAMSTAISIGSAEAAAMMAANEVAMIALIVSAFAFLRSLRVDIVSDQNVEVGVRAAHQEVQENGQWIAGPICNWIHGLTFEHEAEPVGEDVNDA